MPLIYSIHPFYVGIRILCSWEREITAAGGAV